MRHVDHRVAVPGGDLFARAWLPPGAAAGPAFLLFHDSLGSVELWRDFPAALAAATGRRVVAYDRLGFGRSDAHPGRLAPTFVQDEADEAVPRVCDALGLDAIVPLGHSVGGGMAVAAAARWPGRCPAVVTIAAQSFVEPRTLDGIRAARERFADPEALGRVARRHGSKARWVLDTWIGTWLSPAFAGWSLDAELRALAAPVLAVHGDDDEYGSPAHPRRIAAHAGAGARVVLLEGVGHVPHREQPARVLDEVAAFVAPAAVPLPPPAR